MTADWDVHRIQAYREGAPLSPWSPDEAKLFFNAYSRYNSPKGVLWDKVCPAAWIHLCSGLGEHQPDNAPVRYHPLME